MDIITAFALVILFIIIGVPLLAIMGRVSDPEPRDSRIEGPGIPTEEAEADAEYRRRGWL